MNGLDSATGQAVNVDPLVICDYCREPIVNSWIGTGNGKAHSKCFHINNPPKHRVTFQEVLCNFDDQVLVRQLLGQYIPQFIQEKIIDEFNETMANRHQARIAD